MMRRWHYLMILAMLLLLPTKTGCNPDEDDDDDSGSNEANDDDKEDDDNDDVLDKVEQVARRAPPVPPPTKNLMVTRTVKKRALECFVCSYKNDNPLRACLDPTKYRVHTITCHSVEDKCFTSVISKGSNYESVVRGCKTGCIGTPEITCCEFSRCNNQALAMPVMPSPRALATNKVGKAVQPSVFFFVTILLVLQTVVKVSFV